MSENRPARRTRLFVDYWNFQLSWNSRSGGAQCDWRALPLATVRAATSVLSSVGLSDPLELEETLLYASVDPQAESNLRRWLDTFVDRLPSWRVTVRERRPQPRTSSDADFVPAVKRIQERGLKVINAAWRGRGHELKAACWASFDLDPLIAELSR